MRLQFIILALLVAASPAAAQPPEPEGQIYSGFGTEPFWGVSFEDGKITFTENEERIEVPRPRPVTTRAGVHVYRTPRLTVEISHEGRCNDGMSEYEYSDTVRIYVGPGRAGRPLEGCGGELLPPVTLAASDWYVVDVNGVIVGGENYVLHFDDAGRLSGQVGCNRFSGPYTQHGQRLTPGAITATACSNDEMSPETRVTQLLRGPVQMYFRGGMIMILQEAENVPGVYVTLRRQ